MIGADRTISMALHEPWSSVHSGKCHKFLTKNWSLRQLDDSVLAWRASTPAHLSSAAGSTAAVRGLGVLVSIKK